MAYFFTTGKLVFAATKAGIRHLVDRPLAELQAELDPARFFGANRAYLIHIDAGDTAPMGKAACWWNLRPAAEDEVVVSQERAAALRAWLGA